MAIRAKDIYDGRKKSRGHVGLIIALILAVFVVAILIFYGLREYAVYDENGNATIVLPWSQKADAEVPTTSPNVDPTASPAASETPSPSENPTTNPSPTEVGG